jgi:GH18 family chitinase
MVQYDSFHLMLIKYIRLFLLSVVLFQLAACSQTAETPTPLPTPTPAPPFKIIGYVTPAVIVETIPFDKLTHVNYAFAIPNEDGTLKPLGNKWKLGNLVDAAHAQNVKVLISVGGWGYDDAFEMLAADETARATLVQALVDLVETHNLDGVDMDWEYPDAAAVSPDSADNYVKLMQALGAEMRDRDKLLTAAVAAVGPSADGITAPVFAEVDFLNLMVYDKGGEGHHSPLSYAEESLAYWRQRGLPQEKTVLGVPFYGRPQYLSYREIVKQNREAAWQDEIEYFGSPVYYNGIPTIQEKTKLALEEASGIMFWTLEEDTIDETSLLQAIFETAGNAQNVMRNE